jgi:hypothetical protein
LAGAVLDHRHLPHRVAPGWRDPRPDRRRLPGLVSDGYGAYRKFKKRQRCLAHLIRKGIALAGGLNPQGAHFGAWLLREVRGLIHEVAEGTGARIINPILARLKRACRRHRDDEAEKVRALAREVLNDWAAITAFVTNPDLPATNNEAERALRDAVIARRISNGTRTEEGSAAYAATLSVFETCRRRGVEPWRYITDLLARARKGLPHFIIPLSAWRGEVNGYLGRNQARLGTGQHGLRLIKRQADLLELVITLVKAGNHVLAEHGVIIGDDPELDLNSHGLSEGSVAEEFQPTCLQHRRPRHPTDFYALHHNAVEALALHSRLDRIKWRLWHGDTDVALNRARELAADVAVLTSDYPGLQRFAKAATGLVTDIDNKRVSRGNAAF